MIGFDLTKEYNNEEQRMLERHNQALKHIKEDNKELRHKLVQIKRKSLSTINSKKELDDYYAVIADIIAITKDVGEKELMKSLRNSQV